MSVRIDTVVLGPLMTNGYVLDSAGVCWVVDPGPWPEPLLELLRRRRIRPECLLLTHGHGDHIAGLGALKAAWPDAKIVCPAADANMLSDPSANLSAEFALPLTAPPADQLVESGQVLLCGDSHWQVLDTSGHTPGGVSYYCPEAEAVLTGDALFEGSIGRTDLPGADFDQLIGNLRRNLLPLPGETRVLPGHGPESTIGRERRSNPFLTGRAGEF